jgi:hypothetical protein
MTDPRPEETTGSRPSRSAYMRAYRARYKATRKRVSVVLRMEDWRALRDAAVAQGKRPQVLAKSVVLDHLANRRPIHPEAARRLDEALRLLSTVANNVNQIAHRLNEDALAGRPAPDAREARALLGGIFEGLGMVRSEVASMAAKAVGGGPP